MLRLFYATAAAFGRLLSRVRRLLSAIRRRLRPRILLLCFMLLASAVLAINVRLILTGDPMMYSVSSAPQKQAALILGARILGKNTVSHILADRLETGIALYNAGKVQKLLISGDHGQRNYDEVNVMRRYLLASGIPPEDIFMDHAGFDTYDSVYRAKEVFGVESMLIVTQRFHLYRGLFIARSLNIDAAGVDSSLREYNAETQLRNDFREVLARVKAYADVLLVAKPTFLGTKMPISGDGRMTIDE